MRLPLFVRSLVSGGCVYFIAAACNATVNYDDSSSSPRGGSLRDALADVFGSPVSDAKADEPTAVRAQDVSCDKILKLNGVDSYVATLGLPGKTPNDLTNVRVLAPSRRLEGYEWVTTPIYIRGESVAVVCQPLADGTPSYKITFLVPQ